jgi:hypothetical protein
MRSVTFLRSIPRFRSYLTTTLHYATSLHCAKCEASNSTTSPTATFSGPFECYSLRGFKPCSWTRPSKSIRAGNDSSRHSMATSHRASESNASNLTRNVPLRMMYLVRRASLRNIILRLRPTRSKRGTLPTELARLRADAIRAAGLSVLPTSLCIGLRLCRTAGRFLRVRTWIALENW